MKAKRTVYVVVDSGDKDNDKWLVPRMAFSDAQDAIACSIKRIDRNKQYCYDYPGVIAIDFLVNEETCENVYDETECGACSNGFKCSVCGEVVEDYEGYCVNGTWNFCPGCGRKVVECGH